MQGKDLKSFIRWIKHWKPWFGIFFVWTNLASPVLGADPIRVVIEGLEGEALKNAQAALALPSGLIQDGVVNQTLREIFERQIPEKIRQALEPLGYFSPQVKVNAEKTPEGQEVLRVAVSPGGTGAGFPDRYQDSGARRKGEGLKRSGGRLSPQGRRCSPSGKI